MFRDVPGALHRCMMLLVLSLSERHAGERAERAERVESEEQCEATHARALLCNAAEECQRPDS